MRRCFALNKGGCDGGDQSNSPQPWEGMVVVHLGGGSQNAGVWMEKEEEENEDDGERLKEEKIEWEQV